jgi:hypothetical protein
MAASGLNPRDQVNVLLILRAIFIALLFIYNTEDLRHSLLDYYNIAKVKA